MKFTFAFFLALVVSGNAMAKVLECLPEQNYGMPTELAAKAVLDINDENPTITVILQDGRPFSGSLVPSDLGPNALALNDQSAKRERIDVTVMSNFKGETFALVSPLHAMSLPQRLVCK
jgi:hypothetical protein